MSQHPLRIFVVDNHSDTLRSISAYLESFGHTVDGAGDLKEALKKIPEFKPQVVLSDIGLPDGTGWSLMEKAGLPDGVFCIAMSGLGMTSDREHSRRVGFRHHLLKPFKPEELDAALEEAAELFAA